ncbi:MAG: hypothetical protein DHS20C01_10900 [marine bacterium B5-7]|nr:MAG: hypothetical protein DHS20C01_10900 [marine bacterium B5-7]
MSDNQANTHSNTLPEFSLVLETVNLGLADVEGIDASLNSIAQQDVPIESAREVLLVDSGDVPRDRLQDLTRKYPWLQVVDVTADTGYEAAKQQGFSQTTGEIVIFFDADCEYQQGWLRGLLEGMRDHPEFAVLGGVTLIRPDGSYGMAISATFSFEFYAESERIFRANTFQWNNVAFRCQTLKDYPIPVNLPMFRTPPKFFADQLLTDGLVIGRQPVSRALHAPPVGFMNFIWRYLLFGHDAVIGKRLRRRLRDSNKHKPSDTAPIMHLPGLIVSRLKQVVVRLKWLLRDNPRRWLQLPLALVIMIFGFSLMAIGYLLTLIWPHALPGILPQSVADRTGLDRSKA